MATDRATELPHLVAAVLEPDSEVHRLLGRKPAPDGPAESPGPIWQVAGALELNEQLADMSTISTKHLGGAQDALRFVADLMSTDKPDSLAGLDFDNGPPDFDFS